MTTLASSHPQGQPLSSSRLGRVFWLQGVLPSNVLWAVTLWAFMAGQLSLVGMLFAVLLVYTGWIIRAVWRAAPSARNADIGVAARGLTVGWGLNTVLLVFFLALELFAR